MAKFVYGMAQSLDGYVDHTALPAPGPKLFGHFIDWVGSLTGSVYGRVVYQLMQYWDEDRPEWGEAEREFAVVWRRQPKWVVSGTLKSVGPNATLIEGDLEAAMRDLKSRYEGEIEVAGPRLAQSLTDMGLIDEYRLIFRPFVLGAGAPFFVGARPPLRLIASGPVGEDAFGLNYVPA